MRFRAAVLASTILLAAAGAAQAQDRSNLAGFSLGAALSSTSITFEDDDGNVTNTGVGLGLRLGYGLTQRLALYVELHGSAMTDEDDDEYILGHADLGLRYALGSQAAALRPFLDFAVTARTIRYDFEDNDFDVSSLEFIGAGLSLGGGAYYFLTRSIALEGSVKFMRGSFDRGREDEGSWIDLDDAAFDANSMRINLGLRWHR
jgi:hypothetical protein